MEMSLPDVIAYLLAMTFPGGSTAAKVLIAKTFVFAMGIFGGVRLLVWMASTRTERIPGSRRVVLQHRSTQP